MGNTEKEKDCKGLKMCERKAATEDEFAEHCENESRREMIWRTRKHRSGAGTGG